MGFPNFMVLRWEEQKSSVTCWSWCCIPLPALLKSIGTSHFLQMDHKWHMYSWCALALREWNCICQLACQPEARFNLEENGPQLFRNSKEQILNHPLFLSVQSHPLIGKWEAQSAQITGKMCLKQPMRHKTELPTPWYQVLAAVCKSDLANHRVPGSN